MTRNSRSARIGLPAALLVIISMPFLLGQGCPGLVGPVDDPSLITDPDTGGSGGTTGNAPPSFRFLEPDTDVSVEVGATFLIEWETSDTDSNAAITLLADPDRVFGNGNERVILPLVLEDSGTTTFNLDTSVLPPGTYSIIARVNDNVNPELIAVATGRLLLFGSGYLPGNVSPVVVMTAPDTNVGVAQGETIQMAYCARDPDDGLNNVVPDVIVLLDLDEDPANDLVLTGPNAEANLTAACGAGGFPRQINGALILGCFKDNDCQALANATQFPFTVDIGQIPPRPNGDPYWPRTTVWDRTNPPVHSYSRGNVSITSLGSGLVDAGQIGRTISGSKFYGFDAGGRAGSNAVSIGDFNNDGADDFVVVVRYGRPFEVGNVGSAYVVLGQPGVKYGSEVSLNAVGTLYDGSMLTMPATTGTEGIVSVCRVDDVDGDNLSELLVGLPYVEILYDNLIDDLHNCAADDPGCYGDLLPNPLSIDVGDDDMKNFDWREIPGCSNDFDLNATTPIDGGYAIMVSSQNLLGSQTANVFSLGAMGQGGGQIGARFRGAWYDLFDYSQTLRPYAIIPDNRFGETVNTMPAMNDNGQAVSPRFGSTLLVSAPLAERSRGSVFHIPGQDFTQFNAPGGQVAAVQSFPYYTPVGACPGVGRIMVFPGYTEIIGAAAGDNLGYAAAAGDYNLDGSRDILCGAPGATRNGVREQGIVYVLFGRPDFPSEPLKYDLQAINPPRMEIRGINAFDRFGAMQAIVGDVNQDGLADIGFGSRDADGPGGVDSGFVGIVFGGRRLTGENVFTVNQVGTVQLPGCKIYGTQPNGHAGATINNAGDFNGDGVDDLIVSAPDEVRTVNRQTRRGVAYIIFGGTHLYNGSFNLAQVGTAQLPGVIIVSPYTVGSAEEAPIDSVTSVGDVNGDGFDDVLVGVSLADFVNPLEPSQRRPDAGEAYLLYGNNTGTNRVGG